MQEQQKIRQRHTIITRIFLTGLTRNPGYDPGYCYFYRRDKVRRIAGGLIPAQKKVPLSISETVLLLLAGAGFAQYGNFLMAILQSFINSTTYQESMTRITEGKSLLMMIFWMGIIAPAAEEMIFRWLIYLRLRDWLKMPVAAVISGLIFGIFHLNPVQIIGACLIGFLLAWLYYKTRSLMACILIHIMNNGLSVYLSLKHPEMEDVTHLLSNPYVLVWAVVFILLLLLSLKQLNKYNISDTNTTTEL